MRDGLLVLARPPAERALVRVSAAADQVDDGDALGRDRVLREQAERARHLARGQRRDRVAVEEHRSRGRPQQPRHPAQQGRLAARVGADDHGDLTVRHVGGEVADHGAVAVAERDVARGQPAGPRVRVGSGVHQDLLEVRPVASSHSRNGAPIAPVTTPTG